MAYEAASEVGHRRVFCGCGPIKRDNASTAALNDRESLDRGPRNEDLRWIARGEALLAEPELGAATAHGDRSGWIRRAYERQESEKDRQRRRRL